MSNKSFFFFFYLVNFNKYVPIATAFDTPKRVFFSHESPF